MRTPILLVLSWLLSGCVLTHGRAADTPAELRSPYGGRIELLVPPASPGGFDRRVEGELLYVEGETLVLLTEDGVVRAPLGSFRRYRYPRPGRFRARWVTPGVTADFRHAARYGVPLTPSQLDALLAAHGHDAVLTVGPDYPPDPAADTASADPPGTAHAGSAPAAAAPTTAGVPARPPSHRPGGEEEQPPAALAAFLAEARATAEGFATLDAAIAAGYRRLGPSFPGMGEHWIHPGRIVSGRLDAARPPVLCFARIDGRPRLTSLAYAVPLGPTEEPPSRPFGQAAWHDHSERVDEESLLLAHPPSHGGSEGPRLAMVHVWIWPENPDGVLAQNNWRLPLAVAGVPVDTLAPSPDAGRGLSLWTTDEAYYPDLFRAAAPLRESEIRRLRATLAEHRALAGALVERRRRGEVAEGAFLTGLEDLWASLWTRIHAGVRPESWDRLEPLR